MSGIDLATIDDREDIESAYDYARGYQAAMALKQKLEYSDLAA